MKKFFWMAGFCLAGCLFGGEKQDARLEEILKTADAPARQAALCAFLDETYKDASLSGEERLKYAWYGFHFGDADAVLQKALEAAGLPADTRILTIALSDYDATKKGMAAAISRQREQIKLLPGAKKDPNRDYWRLPNAPADGAARFEKFVEPPPWVGRWRGKDGYIEVNGYPCGIFAGKRHAQGKTTRLASIGETSRGPRLVGPLYEANWDAQKGAFVEKGGEVLKREDVGRFRDAFPEGAKTLLDSQTGDRFWRPTKNDRRWKVLGDGTWQMAMGAGNHETTEDFGDVGLYVEFRHSYNPDNVNRTRGNSGIYFQNLYEVQLQENFAGDLYEGHGGGIYDVKAPDAQAYAPPMQWQSITIEFKRPQFDKNGKKTRDGEMSVWQNGVKIHDKVPLPSESYRGKTESARPAPIMIQAHGGLLEFRKIVAWPLEK